MSTWEVFFRNLYSLKHKGFTLHLEEGTLSRTGRECKQQYRLQGSSQVSRCLTTHNDTAGLIRGSSDSENVILEELEITISCCCWLDMIPNTIWYKKWQEMSNWKLNEESSQWRRSHTEEESYGCWWVYWSVWWGNTLEMFSKHMDNLHITRDFLLWL